MRHFNVVPVPLFTAVRRIPSGLYAVGWVGWKGTWPVENLAPPRYAPAPLLSRGRRSALHRRADGNVASVSHGQHVPTPTAAAA